MQHRTPSVAVFYTLLAGVSREVGAEVVGAAVLPHGDFAFDPSLVDFKNHSTDLNRAALDVGSRAMALKPDLVVLITPHGVSADRDFLLYGNTNGYNIPLSLAMDAEVVGNMIPLPNTSVLVSFGDGEDQALRWAEVIPLLLLRGDHPPLASPRAADAGRTAVQLPRAVFMSAPSRRHTDTVEMVASGELTRLGQRILVVVSADLAHTHLASGPYGYSSAADPFDE
eukprot:gene1284-425_t